MNAILFCGDSRKALHLNLNYNDPTQIRSRQMVSGRSKIGVASFSLQFREDFEKDRPSVTDRYTAAFFSLGDQALAGSLGSLEGENQQEDEYAEDRVRELAGFTEGGTA